MPTDMLLSPMKRPSIRMDMLFWSSIAIPATHTRGLSSSR